ncbi:MAG: hypothetical protein H0T51_16410 [Pirellulales bacterium]|nr:hypothetical protein [Pirellulales bacterium]
MSAKFTLDGNSGGAVRAVEALNKALDQTQKGAEGAVAPTKRLVDTAQRIKESIDPQEKYNRKMADLEKLVKSGALQIDHARVKASQYGTELDKVSKAGDGAFGSGMVASIASMAGGVLSATGVIAGMTAAFRDVEAAGQKAADSVLNALGSAGELQQLGPESFARGAANARTLRRLGVVSDLSQGFDVAQNLENSGFSESELQFIVEKVAATRVVSAANLETTGGALAKFRNAFGAKEAGSLENVLDKSLFVSTIPGVQTGLTQTITESLKFADAFKKLGAGDEQTLAAFAGVERVSPSAENAAEVLKSFGSQVNARGLAKGDLFSTLANVEQLVKAQGGNASKVLGDQNAVFGYDRLIANRDFIREQVGNIERAGGTLQGNAGLLGTDPNLAAANLRARAAGEAAHQDELFRAEKENLFDAYRSELDARGTQRGEWAPTRWLRNLDLGAADASDTEANAFRAEIQQTGLTGQRVSDELLASMKGYLERLANNSDDTKKRVHTRDE